ncbi:cadherin-like beta sandwich domain-containing protein [Paenibacillus sp. GCM10012307]|uniref:Cadherin-like beta sandwich domain-containing protein n=1 Tax=Paenibacillus roseus TaxID=2798579 RepID=A0A934MPU7_9BACL|nr:cadherin-like beta sandwich domain-containing protein [Paenibacillus roseus]MBJ6360759.1 cadherin-like beta sandwich domain-containing protein [Paenibacillus roseus]
MLQHWSRIVRKSTFVFLALIVMLSTMPIVHVHANPVFDGGDGSEETPFLIANAMQLDNVRNDRWAHYKLIADIDLSVFATADGGQGWKPIPGFSGTLDGDGHTITGLSIQREQSEYVGLFEALYGGKITNLNVLQAVVGGESHTGIVAGLASNAVLNNVHTSGDVRGNGYVGGLVGNLQTASVQQAGSSATIYGSGDYIGGLFGWAFNSEISDSYAEGAVTGVGARVGGLVGELNGGVIKRCYATGSVTGSSAVGGLIGNGTSSFNPPDTVYLPEVENSYALGAVSGESTGTAGGLAGYMYQVTVKNSYSAGAVNASGTAGGFAGYSYDSTVSSSVWDVTLSGKAVGYGYSGNEPGVTGLTPESMSKSASFANWDLTGTWALSENKSYPYLRNNAPLWLTDLTFVPDNGTTGSLTPGFKSAIRQYAISVTNGASSMAITASPANPDALVSTVGGNALVVGNQTAVVTVADPTGVRTSQTYTITINKLLSSNISSDANLSNLWVDGVPVPNFNSATLSYSITVGADVTDVNVTAETADSGATYSVSGGHNLQAGSNTVTIQVIASDGTIKTYTIEVIRSKFAGGQGTTTSPYLIRTPEQFNAIRDSDAYQKAFRLIADIDLSAYASQDGGKGWIPIYLEGSLDGNGHRITGLKINRPSEDNVGLFNYVYLGSVSNLEIVQASVKGFDKTGILVGWLSNATAKNVRVSGEVSGRDNVGGITGYNSGTIRSSSSLANSAGSRNNAGGLVGQNAGGQVIESYAEGTVSSNSQAGGLVGFDSYGKITNSFATGQVTVTMTGTKAGGLVGQATSGTYTNNYATGKVAGGSTIGGLVGNNSSGSFTNNYWNTTTSERSSAAGSGASTGITARTTDAMKNSTNYSSWDFSTIWNLVSGTTTPYLRTAPLPIWLTSVTVTANSGESVTVAPNVDNMNSSYRANVAPDVTSVTVTGATLDPSSVISVSGSANLTTGDNPITINVTGANGVDSRTYSLIVTRSDPSATGLRELALSAGTLNPAFNEATTSYTVSVPYSTSSLNVTPTVSHAGSTVKVNSTPVASGQASGAIALAANATTTVTVEVTSLDGANKKVYTIAVTRAAASTNANLSALTISSGTLSPGFSSSVTSYTASVTNATSSITVRPTVADSTATVKVSVNDGTPVSVNSGQNSSSLSLNTGVNTIVVTVTAQDGSSKDYRISVTRAASSESRLSGLSLSTGVLSPSFNNSTVNYTSSVANSVSSITVKPVALNSAATITVSINGGTSESVTSGESSSALALNTGENTIVVLVTAENGATRTYTIKVTRAKSSVGDITAFSFEGLTPAVTGTINNTTITLTVPYGTDRSALVATFTHSPNSTVAVGSTIQTSGTTPNNFNSPVTYTVTAENGATKSYTVTVNIAPSNEKAITSFSFAEQTGSALIDSTAHTVSIEVASGTDLTGLTATFSLSAGATATIGPVTQSSGVTVNNFTNPVTYVVTAADGSQQNWTVNVSVAIPAAPTGLTHSSITSTGWVQTWTAVTGATGYNVYVDGTKINSSPITATSFTVTDQSPGTTYSVEVTAVNGSGESSASDADSVTTITDAPTGLNHSSVTTTGWVQTWTAVTGATGYNVYVDGTKINSSPITTTSFTVTNQSPGTTYSVKVTALSSAGESSASAVDSVTTITDAPTGLNHSSVTTTGWVQAWTAVTGATGYNVYVDGTKINSSPITTTSFTVTNQSPGTTYSVKVTALSSAGESSASDADSVTTITDAPTGLNHSSVTTTGWVQTWTAVTGATGYNVYVDGTKINSSPVTTTSFTVTNQSPGTTYSVEVTAVNGSGESSASDADSVTTITDAPTGLNHSSVTTTGWVQAWTSVTGATGYNVYVDGTKINSSPITATSFTVTDQSPGSTYSVEVTAVNGSGESSASDADSVTTITDAPTGLNHSSVTTTGWVQAWTAVTGATGYNVYVDGTKINSSPITTTSFTVTDQSPGTTYSVEVTAVNGSGESSASDADSVTTITDAPTGLNHSSVTTTGWVQAWTAVTGATGYNVYVDGTKINSSPITATSFTVTNKSPGTTYSVKVTALSSAGESSASDVDSVTTITDAPTGLNHSSVTTTGWVQAWTAVTGATGYNVYVDGTKINSSPITATSFTVTNKSPGTTYSVKVTALSSAGESSASDVDSVKTKSTPSSSGSGGPYGGTATDETNVNTTDGKLTLPPESAGSTRLDDEIRVIVPAGATAKKLQLVVEKVLNTTPLVVNNETFVSPIFEITKNFTENFTKPVTLIIRFDASKIKPNQTAAIFYYDEQGKHWVAIGDKVEGNTVTAEVSYFGKFAVLAVDKKVDVEPKNSFTDISGHWAESSIIKAAADRIVNGFPNGTFKPNDPVTRAEFAVMLMNALKPQGEGASLSFTDASKIGAWAKTAVAQAVQAGIIHGYSDGRFRPDTQINRVEMAVMIAGALGGNYSVVQQTGFSDDTTVPNWAKSKVEAIRKVGIVTGRDGNRFMPNETATRAEAVTVILRMLEKLEKKQ